MGEDESQDNSQTEAVADETSRKQESSQTPQLGSVGGSDADDDKEEDCEEQTTGSLWGHTRLPPSVYGNNTPSGGNRLSKVNAVTRITKELRDKAEVQAQEASVMDEEY